MLCLPCLGTGQYPGNRTCPTCAGRGELPDDRAHNPMCPFCIGTGRDPFQKGRVCAACGGWGRASSKQTPPAGEALSAARPAQPEPSSNGRGASEPSTNGPAATPSTRLEDLLRDMVGDVDICEPSLDEKGLDGLRALRRCDLIRVLAYEVDADVALRIREFTRELPRFLFRRYRGREIHDRFLLTPGEVVFIGPRAADGDEPPGVVRVPARLAREMIEDVRLAFDRRWSAGDRLG